MFQTPSRACVFMTQQTEFVHSASTGCTDFGGPPPGSAVSLQGLWICRPDCSGFWVCPLQRTRLLLLTRAQTELERQEPDHTPVPAVWGRQAAWAQDTAPAMLRCSAGWEAAHIKHVSHISLWRSISGTHTPTWELYLSLSVVLVRWDNNHLKEFLSCRKSYSAWWRPGCLPLESAGTRTPTCFSQGTVCFEVQSSCANHSLI